MKILVCVLVCAAALVGLTIKCEAQNGFTLTASTTLTSPTDGDTYTNPADLQGVSSSNYSCQNTTGSSKLAALEWTPQIVLYLPGGGDDASNVNRFHNTTILAGQTWTLNNDQYIGTTWFITVSGNYSFQADAYLTENKTGDFALGISGRVNVTVN